MVAQSSHDSVNDSGEEREVTRLLTNVGRHRLNRRDVLRRGIALGMTVPALGWLLAACGDDNDDAGTDSGDSGSGNATEPAGSGDGTGSPTSADGAESTPADGNAGSGEGQNGGTLTLVVTGNVPDLDPQSAYDSTASAVFFGTHEMLVRLKGEVTDDYEPMLAESWESNDDFSEWTFTIPEGVTFHDGTTCDAPAVVASFQRFLNMGLGPVNVISRFVSDPANITAPDATTVNFKLDYGTDVFIAAMASQYGPLVVSPAAVEANKTAEDEFAHEWMRENAVGTGPFKLKEYTQNEQIVLERFEEYHGGWEGNHFDEIVYRIVTESGTRRQLVETGDADALTQSLTPEDVDAIESDGELNVVRYDSTNADWISMNYVRLADPKLREAMCWAFPYDDVREGVMKGLYEASSGPCTPTTRGYPTDGFVYTYDPDKAAQLLEESGFDTSEVLEHWISSSGAVSQQIAQLFQANLADLGITLDIVQKESGALTDFNYGEAPAEERPHFVDWGWWPDYNDAWNEIYPNFATDSIVPNGSNAGHYSNAEVDALLESISEGAPEEEYNQAITDMNEILVRTDPAGIFMGALKWYTVMAPDIEGFVPNPIYINTYNVYDMYRTGEA